MKINSICVEGVDRCGKTEIIKLLDKATDYKFINVIRGPIGYEAYNRMFNKGQDSEAFKATGIIMSEYTVTIFIRCREETLRQRMIDTNEILRGCNSVEDSLLVMMERQSRYLDVFKEASFWPMKNLYVIDNDGPLEETVAQIVALLGTLG